MTNTTFKPRDSGSDRSRSAATIQATSNINALKIWNPFIFSFIRSRSALFPHHSTVQKWHLMGQIRFRNALRSGGLRGVRKKKMLNNWDGIKGPASFKACGRRRAPRQVSQIAPWRTDDSAKLLPDCTHVLTHTYDGFEAPDLYLPNFWTDCEL